MTTHTQPVLTEEPDLNLDHPPGVEPDSCPITDNTCLRGFCAECNEAKFDPLQKFRKAIATAAGRLGNHTYLGTVLDPFRKASLPGGLPECKRAMLERELTKLHRKRRLLLSFAARAEKRAWFTQTVPRLYRDTDPSLLPDPKALAASLHAGVDGGLLLFGSTGCGKTRTAYLALRETLMSTPWSWEFKVLEGSDIADAGNRFARAGSLGAWIDEVTQADCIFIDDVGHGSFSNSYAEALRKLLERCTSREIPIIVTSQHDAAGLLKAWCKDDPARAETAKAIVRRLAEFTTPIKFSRPKTHPSQ